MKARGKTFLSPSIHESGAVSWEVISGKDLPKYSARDMCNAVLRIKDCNDGISLDFDCETLAHLDKRIQKLDVLISELQNMREALEKVKEPQRFYY